MRETHLFILWENAREKEKEILEDIKKNFEILGLYNIKWNKENFSNNLSRFYGTNLPENSGKEQHCGNGRFLLIVVGIDNPKYEERQTSKGPQIVNTNMFDKKTYYRELTGGGHKVHATNSEVETNHDLTLLLGKNIEDYLKEIDTNKKEEIINLNKDLVGQEGFSSVKEMFYVLNNCMDYAIIRNYESLPDEIYVNEHNDIDIVCDSYQNAVYVLNAEKVFQEEYRVHYKVKVEGKIAYFDLRYVGDDYYYYKFEQNIIKNRKYNEKGFYTISDEEYFYGLIYHALIHKPQFSEDYKKRLEKMNPTNIKLETEEDYINLLEEWLIKNEYKITKPEDHSVQFNNENVDKFNKKVIEKNNKLQGIEKEIAEYINKYSEDNYLDIIKQDDRLDVILALSKLRKNIVNWYPFGNECSILEIGANFGEITGALCQKAKRVISLEQNTKKKDVIEKRHKKFSNLEVVDSLDDINEKFDYITLIGLEKSNLELHELLGKLKEYLKPHGKILLATNNKLSIDNMSKLNSQNETIEDMTKKQYSLSELEKKIRQAGFENRKVYYPLTDYKLPNVIFTFEEQLIENLIARNIVYNDKETVKLYEQNNLYRELLKEDIKYLEMFINSFFIEIFNGESEENEIKLVSFSNMRKEEFRIKTIMKPDYVYKYNENERSKAHLNMIKENIDILKRNNLNTLDSYDEEKIISRYTTEKSLDKVILDKIKNSQREEAIELIKKFKTEIFEKMEKCDFENNVFDKYNIKYKPEDISKMTFLKYGLWDMIFQNCFVIDNEFYFYDQEWREEKVPINFMLYRAIKYFPEIRFYLTIEELYDILNIDESMINLFEELDNKLQENIRNEHMWKIHRQGKTVKELKIEKLTADHKVNLRNIVLAQKDAEINNLKAEIDKLNKDLREIYNSRSWKITKPLRKLKNIKNSNN